MPGSALMLEAIAEAESTGFTEQHARALNNLGGFGLAPPHHAFADTYLPQAIEFCAAHNEDLWHINALAYAARNALDRGRWAEAADFAECLLQDPRESPWPHHEALIVLALVRARRGDPGADDALDEAERVGVPAEDLGAQLDLASARAEVAWLEQRAGDLDAATEGVLRALSGRGVAAGCARISFWRLLAGLEVEAELDATGAHALALAGRWEDAAAEWERCAFPYEAALALIETNDEGSLRQALTTLQELGALPRRAARHAPTPCPRRQGGHARAAEGDT